jgi:hypothetical protein
MDAGRHVIGCHATKQTRIPTAFNDVASGSSWDVMLLKKAFDEVARARHVN